MNFSQINARQEKEDELICVRYISRVSVQNDAVRSRHSGSTEMTRRSGVHAAA